ncbi:MAG: LysR family transcriptional regulator, partial [Planctomycetota bacterium]
MQRHKIETVSLDAIRVFTLCARHMSFSRAARQLRVSQGAVSRRIKLLEDDLGYRLFERNGRHLALTAKGAHLFGQATEAIDLLAATLEANAPGAANGAVSLA